MEPLELFKRSFEQELEESIRIDREYKSLASSNHPLRTYHVTRQAAKFLTEFFEHIRGKSKEMRKGANHWLYGYYGSGKSHLLAVLRFLSNSEWIKNKDEEEIWQVFTSNNGTREELKTLLELWKNVLDDYYILPISVNFLKYQGMENRSFSNVILRTAYKKQDLSSRLKVAYFEKWYRNTDSWNKRNKLVQGVLQKKGIEDASEFTWEDVRDYKVLSDIVLRELFERETGTKDGLTDLKPSEIDPKEAVSQLENWRQRKEEKLGKPVKFVLLLDEISLFIGDDPDKLTELSRLAEWIDEIGKGNIQLVATAQEEIQEVQPEYAAKATSFSILKDRFPHQYNLPSRHVSEIVQNRLLSKTKKGKEWIKSSILKDAFLNPKETFVYTEVRQNTYPRLDQIDETKFVDYFPLPPYLPPLCLEILSALRKKTPKSAKSIFSGTARAILAIVDSLVKEWASKGNSSTLVNLTTFYDLVEPEIEDILPQKIKIIREIKEDVKKGDLEGIDLDVAKVILFLLQVSEFVPLNEKNIAVSIMHDLNGPTRNQMVGRIGESLKRLEEYIQTDGKAERKFRFTNLIERRIYKKAEKYKKNPNWTNIIRTLDNRIMDKIVSQLPLPNSIPYSKGGSEYQILYKFNIKDQQLSSEYGKEDGLHVNIAIRGFLPEEENDVSHQKETLLNWYMGEEGIKELRERVVGWWSLYKASSERETPTIIQRDLSKRAEQVINGIIGALKGGSYKVRGRTFKSLEDAVKECISKTYPPYFHPRMLQIDLQQLDELRDLGRGDELPEWASIIQVPSENPETHGGSIQTKIRSLIAERLKKSKKGSSVSTLIDFVIEEEQIYKQVKPALYSLIWGLCRKGDFRPVDEEGNPVENDVLLSPKNHAETSLRIATGGVDLQSLLEEKGFLGTMETIDKGLRKLLDTNQELEQRAQTLEQDIQLVEDDLTQSKVQSLLESFSETIREFQESTEDRIKSIDSDQPDWKKIINKTADNREWLNDVGERWDMRSPYLLQLDCLLILAEQKFSWVNKGCIKTAEELKEELEKVSEFDWWTESGWQTFISRLDSRGKLISKLKKAWDTFLEDNEIYELNTNLKDHVWVTPPSELPPSIYPRFEQKYLKPLRDFKSAYLNSHKILKTLFEDLGQTRKFKLEKVHQKLKSGEPLRELEESSISGIKEKLSILNSMLSNRKPEDITGIGVWSGDRGSLRKELKKLVEIKELKVNQINEEGVMIK